jgi:hypothetical protein
MSKEEAIKYLQQLYPNGGHCWLDEQRIEAIGMAVKALQEEPVSEDLGEYINELSKQFPEVSFAKVCKIATRTAKWQKQQMMAKGIEGNILANGMGEPILHLWDEGKHLIDKKVKVVVIEED